MFCKGRRRPQRRRQVCLRGTHVSTQKSKDGAARTVLFRGIVLLRALLFAVLPADGALRLLGVREGGLLALLHGLGCVGIEEGVGVGFFQACEDFGNARDLLFADAVNVAVDGADIGEWGPWGEELEEIECG